jgi:hypothetical protein
VLKRNAASTDRALRRPLHITQSLGISYFVFVAVWTLITL